MGGRTGGSFTPSDLSRLTKAAEERLARLLSNTTKIVFACEASDRRALDSHLGRSRVFSAERILVADSQDSEAALAAVDEATLLVVFTSTAADTSFLDSLVEAAFVAKKQVVHVRGAPESKVPSKVNAYRWPSMGWEELEALFE